MFFRIVLHDPEIFLIVANLQLLRPDITSLNFPKSPDPTE